MAHAQREAETITLDQFITKHGVKFECKRVESRPDGLMGDDNDTDKIARNRAAHVQVRTDNMRHFRCRISRGHRVENNFPIKASSFGLYFSQGSAHTENPTLADVLDCLASDASGYENACTFEDWASEYGYETDSRKAEKTFRAIKRQAEQLKRTLGEDAYQELLYNTERM
jgi:hypothetical protein